MITKLKRKDLKMLTGDNICGLPEYYALDQASDKIRAIYVLFGWNQSNNDMFDTLDTVLHLVDSCANHLIDNPKSKETTCSSGGISVELFESSDFDGQLDISVSFNIIN